MYIKYSIFMFLSVFSCGCWGCSGSEESNDNPDNEGGKDKVRNMLFTSSDNSLERTFYWAKKTALSYAHDGSDPVGYWYEAALPGRNAFCMRDASHQSIAAEILGLSKHNLNMMKRFAENISEPKDWCTHWEIDKYNNPCSADYVNDANFWYNLNANFDVIFGCWRLYEWTGNEQYLKDAELTNFFKLSVNEYVERWQLEPEKIMNRPKSMNAKPTTTGGYRETRGLPSYVENYPGLTASSDLIAAIYGGFEAYSRMQAALGKQSESEKHLQTAEKYRTLLEEKWWNSGINAYHTFWTAQSTFADGEGLTYMLWFNAAQQTDRIRGTIAKMMSRKNWNIENVSHFPLLWYRYNHVQEAYEILTTVSTMNRSTYPEVSYGMIEGIISGAMGIVPSASQKKVITLPKLSRESDYLQIEDLPMLQGYITVRHEGNKKSKFVNNTPDELTWQAAYMGQASQITVNGEKKTALTRTDIMGNKVSYVDIKVPAGAEVQAKIE